MGVGLKPASLRKRFTAGQTVPALSGYCEESRGWTSFCQAQRKGNQLASRVTQLPRVQQGDPAPTGASSSAGGVGEEGRKRAEAGGFAGLGARPLQGLRLENLLHAGTWAQR